MTICMGFAPLFLDLYFDHKVFYALIVFHQRHFHVLSVALFICDDGECIKYVCIAHMDEIIVCADFMHHI